MSDTAGEGQERDGTTFTEERHEAAAPRSRLRVYVGCVLTFPVLLLLGSTVWMMTPEYQDHAQFPSFVGLGYGSRLHGADCEVVVDGDSSALTGVVPAVIEQRTGLKTCNIADVAGVKYINGMAVLDGYLARNRPPRFLVLLFVPENLNNPRNWVEVAHFEGWFYALRFHRGRALLHRIVEDPEDFMISAELGLRTGLQWLPFPPLPPELAQARERHGGRLAEPGPPPNECAPPLRMRPPDPAWVAGLRERYSRPGTTVLIDVTPEPRCDPSFAFYALRLGPGLIDNTLQSLPLNNYTDTGRLHTGEAGAQILSERLAEQIAASEHGTRETQQIQPFQAIQGTH